MLAHKDDPLCACAYNVMLDFDSIIFPMLEAMASLPGGQRISYANCPTYESLPLLVDGGVERMLEMFAECASYKIMRQHPPFAGAVAMTNALAELGVKFHVKTERDESLAENTRRYLDEHSIPFVSFRCQTPLDKIGECEAEKIAVAVDDHSAFIARATAAGITVITLGYPYNVAVCQEVGAGHAKDWPQLAPMVVAAVESKIRQCLQA
jgi:hypothetical protein